MTRSRYIITAVACLALMSTAACNPQPYAAAQTAPPQAQTDAIYGSYEDCLNAGNPAQQCQAALEAAQQAAMNSPRYQTAQSCYDIYGADHCNYNNGSWAPLMMGFMLGNMTQPVYYGYNGSPLYWNGGSRVYVTRYHYTPGFTPYYRTPYYRSYGYRTYRSAYSSGYRPAPVRPYAGYNTRSVYSPSRYTPSSTYRPSAPTYTPNRPAYQPGSGYTSRPASYPTTAYRPSSPSSSYRPSSSYSPAARSSYSPSSSSRRR